MTAPDARLVSEEIGQSPENSIAQPPVPAPAPVTLGLGQQMRRGVAWTAASRVAVQALQFGTSIVLARLLVPEDFGVASLVLTVTGFATIFVDLGLSAAIVQRDDISEKILATAFWLNTVIGVVMSGVITALAIPLAAFFDAPELRWLLPVASLGFALSLGIVQNGLLRRNLDFRRLGLVAVVNTVVTTAVGIGGALAGWGALALVLGSLAATITSTIQVWIYIPWRPRARPTRECAADLWQFSRGLLGFSAVNYWSRNADNLLIGKYLGASALGYYGRAYNLMMTPVSQMSSVLTSVLFPSLSKLKADRTRFGRNWLISTKASWLVGTPIGIGVAVTAPALVDTVYGARWAPLVPVLALLSASVPAQLIGSNTGPVFQALGRTGLQFRLSLVTSAITVGSILIALPFGITAVASALLAKSWLALWIPLIPALRLAGVRVRELVGSLSYTALASVVMAAAAWSPRLFADGWPAPALLLAQVGIGACVYTVFVLLGEKAYLRTLRGRR